MATCTSRESPKIGYVSLARSHSASGTEKLSLIRSPFMQKTGVSGRLESVTHRPAITLQSDVTSARTPIHRALPPSSARHAGVRQPIGQRGLGRAPSPGFTEYSPDWTGERHP